MLGLWLAVACGGGDQPTDPVDTGVIDLTVQMDAPTQGHQLVTPTYEVAPNSEVDVCSIVKLEGTGETLQWVSRMESLVSQDTHHMNVLIGQFSFLDAFLEEGAAEAALGADIGQMLCSELPIMEQAFPIFPSQRQNQEITLPDGVAAPLTAPLLLVFSHHYVNTQDRAVAINAVLNVETVEAEEVSQVAGLIFDDIGDLEVESGTRKVLKRTCVVERDVSLALVSTHTHNWTECATLNLYDGASETVESDPFFMNKRWDQPPILHFEPGSMELAAGDGVHWACHTTNPTDLPLTNDGTADGEMCVFAAVSYPSSWSVDDVEQTVANGDVAGLASLMTEVMGPCDTTLEDVEGPWPTDAEDLASATDTCGAWDQTESNTLDSD